MGPGADGQGNPYWGSHPICPPQTDRLSSTLLGSMTAICVCFALTGLGSAAVLLQN